MTYSMFGAMTIESALEELDKFPDDYVTDYGWVEAYSYRGFYQELSVDEGRTTIAQCKEVLQTAVGGTFIGYKGGEFVMKMSTGVWLAPWGDTGIPLTKDRFRLMRFEAEQEASLAADEEYYKCGCCG